MRRRLATALVTALTLPGVAACGDGSDSGGDSSIKGLTVTGTFGKKPKVKTEKVEVSSPESDVIVEGDGDTIEGDGAAMARILIAQADGTEVGNNYSDPEPFKMVLSEQPEVLIDAIDGETIGSRIAVASPASDLYGAQGNPQAGIAPDDTVIFVVDLIEAAEPPVPPLDGPEGKEVDPPASAPKVVAKGDQVTGVDFADAPAKPPAELQVIPLIEGEGAEVKENDPLTVNYLGTVWGKGDKPFDESFSSGTPAEFQLTQGGLIDGWVEGLQGVKVGSRVMLVIPPEQGYGEQGSPPDIPGNATLVFVIDVLGAGG